MISVLYGVSFCIGIFICYLYFGLKFYDVIISMATNQVAPIQVANPQTVQTVMINEQIMQVATPSYEIMNHSSADMTGNVSESESPMMTKPASVIPEENDSPPSYQVYENLNA